MNEQDGWTFLGQTSMCMYVIAERWLEPMPPVICRPLPHAAFWFRVGCGRLFLWGEAMAFFKRKRKLSDAEADELADRYLQTRIDAGMATQEYRDFVKWADGNDLETTSPDDSPVPWRVLRGKGVTLNIWPVFKASGPASIEHFHVLAEIEGMDEPDLMKLQPSVDEVQVIVDGVRAQK